MHSSSPRLSSALPGPFHAVDVRPVSGPINFLRFCRLPRKIYTGWPGYSPHLDIERITHYSERLNPHYKLVTSQKWLAWKDGLPVGRIEAQIYKDLQPLDASKAQFGSLDAIDDPHVVAALMRTAEQWLAAQGAQVIHGPFSNSINNEVGMLVCGFDNPPMIFIPWHPPYLSQRLEELGYVKARDLYSYRYDVSDRDRLAEPVIQNRKEWRDRLKFRTINMKNLHEEVKLMQELFNDAWSDNWGFVPFSLEEFQSLAGPLKHIVPPEYVFFIELDGAPVAFGVNLPNLQALWGDLHGRLTPLRLWRIMRRLRASDFRSVRLLLFGMRRKLHKTAKGGIIVLALMEEMRLRSRNIAMDHIEFGWVLENNMGMRRPIEMSGALTDKIHRMYEKQLPPQHSPSFLGQGSDNE